MHFPRKTIRMKLNQIIYLPELRMNEEAAGRGGAGRGEGRGGSAEI